MSYDPYENSYYEYRPFGQAPSKEEPGELVHKLAKEFTQVMIVRDNGESEFIKIKLDEDGSIPCSTAGDSTEGDERHGRWCLPFECIHLKYRDMCTKGGRGHIGVFCEQVFTQSMLEAMFR